MTRNPDSIPIPSDRERPTATHTFRRGFTLSELLVVCGLIAMLLSLLLPVISKARSAAQATRCLSNLREMGNAWATYTAGNRGHLMGRTWFVMSAPDFAWHAYWPGILENYGVRGELLTCPVASEPIPTAASSGYGTATYSWSGQYVGAGTAIRLDFTHYRDGSYGMNRYLTAGNGFGENGLANKLTAVRNTCEVPVFMDCAWVDTQPENGSEANPTDPPPNLRGDQIGVGNAHWLFLLARHGRGVNVVFADGSARWVRLEDTYMMSWNARWARYRIPLPSQ
jgi:prepilin-type processing-associated H-X9-DG protein/prepilin-type N-terminal cleavage/methylation domain-containing protein